MAALFRFLTGFRLTLAPLVCLFSVYAGASKLQNAMKGFKNNPAEHALHTANNGDYGVNYVEIIVFLNILLPHIVFSWLPSVQTKRTAG